MKIEDRRKQIEEKPKAKAGDLIKIDGDLCLIVDKHNWTSEFCKGKLAVVLLNYKTGEDWMSLANIYQELFEEGNYTIYAKKGTWGIFRE